MTGVYTTAEAATMLNVTERWLLDQLRARRFAGHKMGGKWRMTRLRRRRRYRFLRRTGPAAP
jgi:excisionase family DNA binding protein